MGNRPIPRIDLREAIPWPVPEILGVDRDKDGELWVRWDPYETRRAEPSVGALDSFVKLACYRNERWRDEAVRRFVERWGPWGFCARRDRHEPFRPGMPIAAVDALLSPRNRPPPRELLGDLLLSASRVNALRTIASGLRDYRPGDRREWERVGSTRGGFLARLDIAAQQEALGNILEEWLAAAHVRPAIGWIDDDDRPAVGLRVLGPSGALALEFVRELVGRVPVAVCADCRTTFQVESSRRTRCASCASAARTTNRRKRLKEVE